MIGTSFDFKIEDNARYVKRADFEQEFFDAVKGYRAELEAKVLTIVNKHIGYRLNEFSKSKGFSPGIAKGTLVNQLMKDKATQFDSLFGLRSTRIATGGGDSSLKGKTLFSISVGLNYNNAYRHGLSIAKMLTISQGRLSGSVKVGEIAGWIKAKIAAGRWTPTNTRSQIKDGFVRDKGLAFIIAKTIEKDGIKPKLKGLESLHPNSVNYRNMRAELDALKREYKAKITRILTWKIKARNKNK